MKRYIDYLKISLLAKITGILLLIIFALIVFNIIEISAYLSTMWIAVVSLISILIVGLLWLLHYKKEKISVVVEILLCLCLVAMSVAMTRVNTFTDEITETNEVETVQIVALKDSNITADQSFDNLQLAYVQDDENAYKHSTEILKENNKKVKKEKPYKDMEAAYNDLKNKKTDL